MCDLIPDNPFTPKDWRNSNAYANLIEGMFNDKLMKYKERLIAENPICQQLAKEFFELDYLGLQLDIPKFLPEEVCFELVNGV